MPKLNDSLEAMAPSGGIAQDNQPRYGRLLVVLMLLLLLLGYVYLYLTKPPVAVKQAPTPGVNHVFSIYGWGKERFNNPNGVAVDKSGNIYVADTGNHRVAVFSSSGRFQFAFGSKDKSKAQRLKKDQLLLPLNVDVDDNNNIYVASSLAGKLSIFNSRGKFLRRVMIPQLIQVAVDKNRIYASTARQVLILNLKGKILKRLGSKGRKLGQFELPNGLAVDKKGNLFVSDSQNMRIQIFNKNGKLVGGRGAPPKDMNDSNRLFGLGLGLTLDDQENVYVADAFHHGIRVFSYDGEDYGSYGEQGSYDGQFNYPSDVVAMGGGLFAVADKWNDRVEVVQLTPSTGAGKPINGAGQGRPWWFWPLLLLIILIITVLVVRWVRGRSRRRSPAQRIPEL